MVLATTQEVFIGTAAETGRALGLTRFRADQLLRILQDLGLARQIRFKPTTGRPAAVWECPRRVELSLEYPSD